jgi:hypothetical protein
MILKTNEIGKIAKNTFGIGGLLVPGEFGEDRTFLKLPEIEPRFLDCQIRNLVAKLMCSSGFSRVSTSPRCNCEIPTLVLAVLLGDTFLFL